MFRQNLLRTNSEFEPNQPTTTSNDVPPFQATRHATRDSATAKTARRNTATPSYVSQRAAGLPPNQSTLRSPKSISTKYQNKQRVRLSDTTTNSQATRNQSPPHPRMIQHATRLLQEPRVNNGTIIDPWQEQGLTTGRVTLYALLALVAILVLVGYGWRMMGRSPLNSSQPPGTTSNQAVEAHPIEINQTTGPSSQTSADVGSNRSIPMAVMASLRNLGRRERQNIPVALPASIRGRRESQEPAPITAPPVTTDDIETQVAAMQLD
jgi:hypothetical protein